MKTCSEIIEKIRLVIEPDYDDNKKITDKHVANALGISQTRLATAKKRNIIPYKKTMDFCVDNNLNIQSFFYTDKISKHYQIPFRENTQTQ